jgi:glucan phosphoethanolaminetransferase (alkaline phosphatase superfamily)
VEFDNLNNNPDFIDSKSVCDSVIDCDNWSDEPLSCSTSITLAYIIVGVAAGIFEIIIGISTLLLDAVTVCSSLFLFLLLLLFFVFFVFFFLHFFSKNLTLFLSSIFVKFLDSSLLLFIEREEE